MEKSHGCLCLCRLKEQNLVKELRPRDLLESSSDSDEKLPVAKPSSFSKRKLELEAETVEKKKKGRPRKDSRLLPMSLSVQVRPLLTYLLSSVLECACVQLGGREALHTAVSFISVGTAGLDIHSPELAWRPRSSSDLPSTHPESLSSFLASATSSVKWDH